VKGMIFDQKIDLKPPLIEENGRENL